MSFNFTWGSNGSTSAFARRYIFWTFPSGGACSVWVCGGGLRFPFSFLSLFLFLFLFLYRFLLLIWFCFALSVMTMVFWFLLPHIAHAKDGKKHKRVCTAMNQYCVQDSNRTLMGALRNEGGRDHHVLKIIVCGLSKIISCVYVVFFRNVDALETDEHLRVDVGISGAGRDEYYPSFGVQNLCP